MTGPMHTATDLLAAYRAGSLDPAKVVDDCLARIAKEDSALRAWQHVAADAARQGARDLPREVAERALHGVPVGIKDIMETRDMPTTWGTDYLYAERSPWDAAPVALLRRAGAIPLGKTVSTEMAYFQPGPTVNPHDPNRTPGGSSSGSAAAVAAGMVPLALGSQTAASVIRPASYCGIVGFKPSHGLFPLAGVVTLSPSLDTLGWFARSVDDIALAYGALLGIAPVQLDSCPLETLRISVGVVPRPAPLEPAGEQALASVSRKLADAGVTVRELDLPEAVHGLADVHNRLMAFEASRSCACIHDAFGDRLSAQLRELLDRGAALGERDHAECRQALAIQAARITEGMAENELLLTPSATGEAPEAGAGTGNPIHSRIWTALGFPSISLPLAHGPNGLPLGMQLIAPHGHDLRLLAAAREIMTRLG